MKNLNVFLTKQKVPFMYEWDFREFYLYLNYVLYLNFAERLMRDATTLKQGLT